MASRSRLILQKALEMCDSGDGSEYEKNIEVNLKRYEVSSNVSEFGKNALEPETGINDNNLSNPSEINVNLNESDVIANNEILLQQILESERQTEVDKLEAGPSYSGSKESPHKNRFSRTASYKGLLAVTVQIEKKEILVLPGSNATFMCTVAVPLQYCRAEIPGLKNFNLNERITASSDVSYYGQGLHAGQCGFTIRHVDESNNGPVRCSLGLESVSEESIGVIQLIVARAPKQPEMDLSRGTDSVGVYKINEVLQASCIVRDGRPVANLSWFLDEELLDGGDLSMPTVVDIAKENLQSKIQNLTRVLRASDNGKNLRCVAYHPAYPRGFSETSRQLDVKFPPLPKNEPIIDIFGYTIGKIGVINITIEANPKPQIEWWVGGQVIKEGSVDNTGSISAESAKDLGRGRYLISLRLAAVKKEDTEKEYVLKAYNDQGTEQYRVKISTMPEPKGLELGIGSIIGIVVAILFVILIVSIVIFARVTGRWCFSGSRDTRHLGESSDTESADVRPRDHKRTLPPIKLTSFFKKNKDKAEEDPEEKRAPAEGDKAPLAAADESPGAAEREKKEKEGLVYAELDLVSPNAPALKAVVKNDDEKTEYAEIVYTPNADAAESKEDDKENKETKK